ncbi:helix-turn-helix domain-containing protein [Sansalvadorimonas sp. 2012CJ34-2]|uniref:Helix-turn-helix domain-containing protein n=1 Tax=Parendozoicomonas callyspongiae TaxID=2942213 RepID=A0ABT0PIA2_9GAMM|nr:S24 family peptidase [Sansalvadorimonas sp. 2012CJ34-2]MCL6271079.1 helix-turn-helix domain-containing protein [Sansalvadorimonas sp. 2012CJ34-2]
MQELRDRLVEAVKSSGLSQRAIADEVEVSAQAVTRWLKSGKISKENLIALASVTGVSLSWLLGQQDELLEKTSSSLLSHDIGRHPTLALPAVGMDQLGDFVAADYHPQFTGNAPYYYAINQVDPSVKAFATAVEGESMISSKPGLVTFLPGWTLIVTPNMTPRSGDFVVALVGDSKQGIFRQYVKDGHCVWLKPLNTQYQMIECTEEVLVCGVVQDVHMRGRFHNAFF